MGLVWGINMHGRLTKNRSRSFDGGQFVWQVNIADNLWPVFQTMPDDMQTQLNKAVQQDPHLTTATAYHRWWRRRDEGDDDAYAMTTEYSYNFVTMEQVNVETGTKRQFQKMCLRIVWQKLHEPCTWNPG